MEALSEHSPDVAAAVDQQEGTEDDDPTEQRPTTRAVRRSDLSVSSTRVPLSQDRARTKRVKGATASASSESSGGTGNRSGKAPTRRSGSKKSTAGQ
jgi:hypothetical protein